jgi:epoxyqueuosine reductase
MQAVPPSPAVPAPDLQGALTEQARLLGFAAIGFARADAPWEAGERLMAFIAEGRHGSMQWMEDTAARRAHPTAMWPEAKSAIVLGMNYGPERDPLESLGQRDRATISVYARGADYHDLIKKRLKQLAGWFAARSGAQVKVFVDTAPLMEKPLAGLAGVGWQGKHTNLVSREHGSYLFLGVILTDATLDAAAPGGEHCGACRACLDICPTQAFPAPFQLDARRCISYLTIEHAGPIPREFRSLMGNRIYGCDDCLAVCPWNKFASVAHESAFHARPELTAPLLGELAALDDASFRQVFSGSPIKRIGRDRFVRNVLIAIGNSGDVTLAACARALLDDPAPVVRGAAVWALARLLPASDFAALREARLAAEADTDVRAEFLAEAA